MRLALGLLVAAALVAVGWYAGRCRFLSWPDGRAQTSATLTLACADDTPCPHAIGAVLAAEPPVLIATGSQD